MKSNLKRTFLWLALSIFTFFVFTLSVNAQEDKTKKVTNKELKEELKKVNRVFKLSPDYESTGSISKEVQEPKTDTTVNDHRINKMAPVKNTEANPEWKTMTKQPPKPITTNPQGVDVNLLHIELAPMDSTKSSVDSRKK